MPRIEPIIKPSRRWLPSKVWIIPLLSALIGLSLVINTVLERGPTITVSFASAEGIEAEKTKVKFKDVDIGMVKEVHLANDRSRVLVTIELAGEARGFAVADSRFWVVRPRLAGSGVSGLETLLSGAYIGVDAGHTDEPGSSFTGLETPPVVPSDAPGRRFQLVTDDIGSLDVGSPVYFHRIAVGHVESFALESDGRNLSLSVFIKSPYDRFITGATRFWHASGIDLRLDADGIKLNTQSLATILMGGIAFETPTATAESPKTAEGTRFTLVHDRIEALKAPDGESLPVVLHFSQSVRGLAEGAPVDFRGIVLGRVHTIGLTVDPKSGDFRPTVTVELFPDRLVEAGLPQAPASPEERRLRVAALVERGLRGQLRSGNLLTGQLYVALDFFPEAPRVQFNAAAEKPELPTVPGDFEELQKQVHAILAKLDKLPLDTLGRDLHLVLTTMDGTLRNLDAATQQTSATLRQLQASAAKDSPLQQDTRQAMRAMTEATRSLKHLTDTLERQPESLLRGRKDSQ